MKWEEERDALSDVCSSTTEGSNCLNFDSFWTYRVNLMVCARVIFTATLVIRAFVQKMAVLMSTSLHVFAHSIVSCYRFAVHVLLNTLLHAIVQR